jgi:hypothetical protein
MIDTERAKKRLQEISKKNEAKEYSLGDVLLLDKFEKELKESGYTKSQIEALSPSYYGL